MELNNGSRIGIVGGGPAGSLTSYFLHDIAARVDLDIHIDIYEAQKFSKSGPGGCNHCGGVISESLVQMLAVEGINLPTEVVQRGLDSYVLHTERDQVPINAPLKEKRIAALHRGCGPMGSPAGSVASFDAFLLDLATQSGANCIQERVSEIVMGNDLPMIVTKNGNKQSYDLVVGAVGVNGKGFELFEKLGINFISPKTTRTAISEIYLGREQVDKSLGNAMHVFLFDMPQVEFAALIPKGDYVTFCMLGNDITTVLMKEFLAFPAVKACLPDNFDFSKLPCKCLPNINIKDTHKGYADRIVLVGDCGTTRLYKDGIGAAYRTAKALALTVILHGVSESDFARFYQPACYRLTLDNQIGKIIFFGVGIVRKMAFFRNAVLAMTRKEQEKEHRYPIMSSILWDTFSGSAPYRNIMLRGMRISFLIRLAWYCFKSFVAPPRPAKN